MSDLNFHCFTLVLIAQQAAWKILQDFSSHLEFNVFSRAEETPGELNWKEWKTELKHLLKALHQSKCCEWWFSYFH